VFVYKRRQSDNHYGVFFSSEKAYLWLCGWILHANGFFDPKEFIPSLYFLKASNPSQLPLSWCPKQKISCFVTDSPA